MREPLSREPGAPHSTPYLLPSTTPTHSSLCPPPLTLPPTLPPSTPHPPPHSIFHPIPPSTQFQILPFRLQTPGCSPCALRGHPLTLQQAPPSPQGLDPPGPLLLCVLWQRPPCYLPIGQTPAGQSRLPGGANVPPAYLGSVAHSSALAAPRLTFGARMANEQDSATGRGSCLAQVSVGGGGGAHWAPTSPTESTRQCSS